MAKDKYTKEELKIIQDANKARSEELGLLRKILNTLKNTGQEEKQRSKKSYV